MVTIHDSGNWFLLVLEVFLPLTSLAIFLSLDAFVPMPDTACASCS